MSAVVLSVAQSPQQPQSSLSVSSGSGGYYAIFEFPTPARYNPHRPAPYSIEKSKMRAACNPPLLQTFEKGGGEITLSEGRDDDKHALVANVFGSPTDLRSGPQGGAG